MFSALKKLTGSKSGGGDAAHPLSNNAQPPLAHSLQKKFSKGVHYNMKIIIKGDRNVGKSALFRRLQGQPFQEQYTATEEIQVANITWNYKTSDDIVKVEIWDIVDVSQRKKKMPSDKLKLDNQGGGGLSEATEFGLDANTIDVYKNTHGVILIFDLTKNWTWDYVKREIEERVPSHLPTLILGNRRDMGHHRQIATDTALYFIESLQREGETRYAESSMRYGFGLKLVHKFFNVPYLHLQKEAFLKQLQLNKKETQITLQELDLYADSEDANYDLFIENVSQKRRQVADALSGQPKLSLVEAQAIAQAKALRDAKDEKSAVEARARLAVKSDPTRNGAKVVGELNNKKKDGDIVEEFIPEADHLQGFLEDDSSADNQRRDNNGLHFESSDEEFENPMVASFVEDVQDLGFGLPTVDRLELSEDDQTLSKSTNIPHTLPTLEVSETKPGFELFVQTTEEETSSDKKNKTKHKKHHHKRKHKKSTSSSTGLEDFLGGGDAPNVDSSAYEAI